MNAISGSATAAYWFQFFLDAGIPPSDGGNYAVTFTENRIQPDMIVDLTKEYLTELGVTALGDMIAILKHAKRVHAQTTKEKVLKGSGLSPVNLANSNSLLSSSNIAAKPSAVGKVLVPVRPSRSTADLTEATDHQSRLSQSSTPKAFKPVKPDLLKKKAEAQRPASVACKKNIHMTSSEEMLPDGAQGPVGGSIVRLKPHVVHEVPVPKFRNVTPQQEGGYKIIYPCGAVRKTRDANASASATSILTTGQVDNSEVRQPLTVFDRLGVENTSTATAPTAKPASDTTLSRKKEASQLPTVFCRLGEKRELKRTETETVDEGAHVKKRSKLTVEDRLGPAKAASALLASSGMLDIGTKADKPIHQRLGEKAETVVTNRQGAAVTGAKLTTKFMASGFQKNNAVTALSVRPTQTVTFNVGSHKKLDDLIIHVEPQSSEGSVVRRFGPQKPGGLQNSSSVMQRLGPQKFSEETMPLKPQKSSSVAFRLGPEKSESEKFQVQTRQSSSAAGSRFVAGLSSPKSLSARFSLTSSSGGSGVFDRLGSKKSAII